LVEVELFASELVTTAAIHPNVIAGETPTLSPYAPASLSDLDKQHELGQFLTRASDTSPLIPLPIRCGEGDMASLFEIHRSEVSMLDAGAGADRRRTSSSFPRIEP
jgi:hypothetical protein